MNKIKIVAICGSLRSESYNKKLLAEAIKLLPEEFEVEVFDIGSFPLYNEDLEENGLPAEVELFKQAIEKAEAVLIASPEYNYSVPGVLKNALDWASAPDDKPLSRKPVGIIGASTGFAGTARMQFHLKSVLLDLNMYVLPKPDLYVTFSEEKFDSTGKLTDSKTQESLVRFIAEYTLWVKKLIG